jgi:hypothetical protein
LPDLPPLGPASVPDSFAAFIEANTVIAKPPLVPKIKPRLATETTPIWQATEAEM